MNRFKGLDLVNKVDNYGWRPMILHRKQQAKSRQRKRKARRQSGYLKRLCKQQKNERSEKEEREGKAHPIKCRVPKNI